MKKLKLIGLIITATGLLGGGTYLSIGDVAKVLRFDMSNLTSQSVDLEISCPIDNQLPINFDVVVDIELYLNGRFVERFRVSESIPANGEGLIYIPVHLEGEVLEGIQELTFEVEGTITITTWILDMVPVTVTHKLKR